MPEKSWNHTKPGLERVLSWPFSHVRSIRSARGRKGAGRPVETACHSWSYRVINGFRRRTRKRKLALSQGRVRHFAAAPYAAVTGKTVKARLRRATLYPSMARKLGRHLRHCPRNSRMSPHLIRIDALRGVAILMVMQLHIFFITFAYDYLHVPTAALQFASLRRRGRRSLLYPLGLSSDDQPFAPTRQARRHRDLFYATGAPHPADVPSIDF